MTFAKEAWPFVLPFALVAVVALTLQRPRLAAVAAVVGLIVLLFFRIPARASTAPVNAVLAPANGKITAIGRVENPEFGTGEFHHIVTFLSVFNIHVQRAPADGKVAASSHRPGRKVAAFRPDAGDVNESQLSVFTTPNGDTIAMRQIAGLLARRVVTYLGVGDIVERGELIGLIKFGSRVDLYLPASYHLRIEEGQTVHEGETVMAEAVTDNGAAGS